MSKIEISFNVAIEDLDSSLTPELQVQRTNSHGLRASLKSDETHHNSSHKLITSELKTS